MRLFFPLSKVEENPDGTLTVEGVASSEEMDSDGEVVRAEAIRDALPEFFRFGTGALREMHQPLAAGTVDTAEVGSDGVTYVTATVVDPMAIRKVRSGVYKGFSIGGRVKGRDAEDRKIITEVGLSEISLVDRPANPKATISLWKGEVSEAAREEDVGATDACGAVGMDPAVTAEAAVAALEAAVVKATAAEEPDLAGAVFKAHLADGGVVEVSRERLAEMFRSVETEGGRPCDEAAAGGGLAELAAEHRDVLRRLAEREAGFAKLARRVEPLAKAVEAIAGEFVELRARIAKVEDMPEPAKYELRVVGKEDDRETARDDGPQTPADAIKKAHRNPIRPLPY